MSFASTTRERFSLSIEGMSCDHCVRAVTQALGALSSAKVCSVAVGSAEIEATPDAAKDALAALEGAGYQATVASRAAVPVNSARAGGCCGGPKGCCG